MKFFHLSVRLTNEKPDAFVCPFDKPIKSLYFRSFVVSVLFARFHFKVIRKSLYSEVVTESKQPSLQKKEHFLWVGRGENGATLEQLFEKTWTTFLKFLIVLKKTFCLS